MWWTRTSVCSYASRHRVEVGSRKPFCPLWRAHPRLGHEGARPGAVPCVSSPRCPEREEYANRGETRCTRCRVGNQSAETVHSVGAWSCQLINHSLRHLSERTSSSNRSDTHRSGACHIRFLHFLFWQELCDRVCHSLFLGCKPIPAPQMARASVWEMTRFMPRWLASYHVSCTLFQWTLVVPGEMIRKIATESEKLPAFSKLSIVSNKFDQALENGFTFFFNLHLRTFVLILERGEKRREGEKHQCERETMSGCLLHEPRPGTEPAT